MSRVSTIQIQHSMTSSMQKAQQALAVTQAQLDTHKKAPDYASLGTEAVRNLSAHSLLDQHDAYVGAAKQVGTTLALNDANIGNIETSATKLKQDLLAAIGTGKGAGMNASIIAAFDQFRSGLNASSAGASLFGGSQTDRAPFVPSTLAETVGMPASTAFGNDAVKATARLGDGVDVEYGVTASDIGSGLYEAFRTLASTGTLGDPPTAAQIDIMSKAAGQIDTGLTGLRTINAENGRKQALVETLGDRASDRSVLLQGIITGNEDADLGQVAINLAQQKTLLEASYSVFSQISGLSLANYLS